jgi:mannose-6-phosphate isomerase-like protein (cupin superfamily)
MKNVHSIHEKSWGHEEWIVNNDLYCGKRLHFTVRGGKTSMHYHLKKHETMYVESGIFEIRYLDRTTGLLEVTILRIGESLVISQETRHQIVAIESGVLIEFSTHHEDSDSIRMWR